MIPIIYKKIEIKLDCKINIIYYFTIMTPRLTTELKTQETEFMLETSRQLILTNFDNNNKYNKTINIENNNSVIKISRNCFTDVSMPYFEDYTVSFMTIIQNEKVHSRFYLEWKNNDITRELITANSMWDPVTGKCSNRKITIKKCKR